MQSYIVKKGDTLYGISSQFGVLVDEIKKINNLYNNNIIVGTALKIPTDATTTLYIVKKGDTLFSISKRFGVTVNDIKKLNYLKYDNLYIGEQLKIPINDINNYENYIVKKDDSLYKISLKYNTTIEELKRINKLQNDNLYVGQIIKVPILYENGFDNYQIYIVKRGDNLYKISKKFGMSVSDLIKLNNLNSDNLYIGQEIKVNSKIFSDIPLGSKCIGSNYVEPKYLLHTVVSGDNLYDLAIKYKSSIDIIKKLNNLKSNNLNIGQILKIKEVI